MNTFTKNLIVITLMLFFAVSSAGYSLADTTNVELSSDVAKQLEAAGGTAGAGYGKPSDPRTIAAKVIRSALGMLGIIFLTLIVYAGFVWMTAAGNEERVEKSKKTMYRATIGLILVLAAYSLTILGFRLAMNYYDDPRYRAGVRFDPLFQYSP